MYPNYLSSSLFSNFFKTLFNSQGSAVSIDGNTVSHLGNFSVQRTKDVFKSVEAKSSFLEQSSYFVRRYSHQPKVFRKRSNYRTLTSTDQTYRAKEELLFRYQLSVGEIEGLSVLFSNSKNFLVSWVHISSI